MGHLNRFVILPHVARVSRVELPIADRDRLRGAVHPSTAAFIAPSHPEFFTDWMIDKELSRRVAPLIASWAAGDIVNASPFVQRFWLANGLIANTPGGGGKTYSLQSARAGRGVLLHPEGAVNWQAEKIWPLHPGTIDMAVTLAALLAAEDDPRPVFVVPMTWRLTFTEDVSSRLVAEMHHIERACGLAVWPSRHPGERLAGLLGGLLSQRAHTLALRRPTLSVASAGPDYFAAQDAMVAEIRGRLTQTFGPLSDDPTQAIRTVERGLRRSEVREPERARQHRALLVEFRRLARLDPALYGHDTLTQEQIAEILKATRLALVTTGLRNRLHNVMPRAVASRIAHVRVAEPIDVREGVAQGLASTALQSTLHRRLQDAADALGAEVEPAIGPFRIDNTLAVDNNRHWLNKGA